MDAIGDYESAKRNLYFFKNNARPDVVVMLDKDVIDDKEQIMEMKKQWNTSYA
jgi:cellulose synthase/poly-beta-1,6-N-acetylglucosamine synthase-like glycosyltransferase